MAIAALIVPALIAIFAGCLVYFLRPRVVTALALVLAALFGAGDQYVGSFSMYPWMTDISLLSAPWLVLAFVAGGSQREARRGALLGLECTYMALLGYGLMTLSPVENAHLTVPGIARFIYSESPVFIGGLVTGPLFGWFGQQWRVHRAWSGALAAAGALCFEPLARLTTGHAIGSRAVLLAEVAAGIAMAAYIVTRKLISSPARPSTGYRLSERTLSCFPGHQSWRPAPTEHADPAEFRPVSERFSPESAAWSSPVPGSGASSPERRRRRSRPSIHGS